VAWVRLDDAFIDHRKFLRAGPLAGFLHIAAIAWCNRNLTDGIVPREQPSRLAAWHVVNDDLDSTVVGSLNRGESAVSWPALVQSLLDEGMWVERDDGDYEIHDYLDFQKSAAEVRADRDKTARRQQKWRNGRRTGDRQTPTDDAQPMADEQRDAQAPVDSAAAVSESGQAQAPASTATRMSRAASRPQSRPRNAVTNRDVTGAPNPNPKVVEEHSSSTSEAISTSVKTRADVEALCQRLADRVEANGSRKSAVTAKWRDACRLLIDRDGRTLSRSSGSSIGARPTPSGTPTCSACPSSELSSTSSHSK
jgi:hypothetical protein